MSLKKFYADPAYQIKAFVRVFAIMVAASAALWALRDASFLEWNMTSWHLLWVPLGIYLGGMSAVFIHNATHRSFPNQTLNEFCGELAGVHQLWGFTGWRLIHLIHHQYSDDVEHDPHPTKGRYFGEYLRNMFIRSSRTVSKRYRAHWGETPRTARLQTLGLVAFVAMALSCLAFWFMLLGPVGFVLGYIPSYLTNHYMFAHINYFCHPVNPETGETAAANLNHHLGYKIANFLWCGIFFHGNHHRKATLFNPRHLKARTARERVPAHG